MLLASGFWITWRGQTETTRWIPRLHSVSAYLTIALIAIHTRLHALQKQKERASPLFRTLGQNPFRRIIVGALGYTATLTLLWGGYGLFISTEMLQPGISPTLTDYQYDYGDHPFRPSQTETVDDGFVLTAQIAKSEQCGACHTDIYEQWLSSMHRHGRI